MIIRKAREEDIDNLAELMQKADNRSKEWAEEKARRFVSGTKVKSIMIAEEDEQLVGYAGLKAYEDNQARDFVDINNLAWVTWIAVLPEYRGRKVGSQLLSSAHDFARLHGKSGIVLDCRAKVIPFYLKNGFSVAGEYMHKGAPRYVLEKIT